LKILLVGINAKFVHTNLAIRYIKSYCSGFNIVIKEYTVNDLINNVLEDKLCYKPDIIGFSCYIWNIEFILKLCSSLKKINSNIRIILGGPEVSFDVNEFMNDNPYIDYIIKGEGEISSYKLFRYLRRDGVSLDDIKGLVYRKGEEIVDNGEPQLIEEIDIIPFPYEEKDCSSNKIIYYESSRGCPYNCTYCLSSTIKGVRFFSIDRVKKDLLWFINNEVKLVKFVDRTFNCNRYGLEIMKFLVDNRRNTRFHFEVSAEILSDEAIEFLTKVPPGLFQFEIGVQSTNNRTLSQVNRNTDIKKLFQNVKKLRSSNNIHIHLDLIAGLPGEDYNSFAKSFDDVMALKPNMFQLGFLKLLKGSKIREDAFKYNIAFTDYPPYEVLRTCHLSFYELAELRNIEEIVDRYYNSGRFSATLKYMLGIENSPFQMFKDIMNFQIRSGNSGKSISNIGQYKLLYDYCRINRFYDESVYKECLAFDYLLQGRNPVMPDFLGNDNAIKREFIWDFLSDKENIKKYLPHYEGYDVKDIIKKIYARAFNINIPYFLDNDEICRINNIVFFDYGYKNEYGQVYYFHIYESFKYCENLVH